MYSLKSLPGRLIKEISDLTGINSGEAGEILAKSGLMSILDNMVYRKVEEHYREGITRKELHEKTGISFRYLDELMRRAKEELRRARQQIALFVYDRMREEASKNPLDSLALDISEHPRTSFSFEEARQRLEDLSKHNYAECAEIWGISKQAVGQFVENYDLKAHFKPRRRQ
jgi:hypothetical protein